MIDTMKIFEEYSRIRPEIKIDIDSIGTGGMKTVYKAVNLKRKQLIVVKIIISQGPDSEKRTHRELEILKKLNSPFFPEIYDVDELEIDNTKVVVSSETFIKGVTLREYMNDQVISEEKVLYIGMELLKALDIIHREKLVHRDIKPENIMITPDEKIVILDFGIARDLKEDSITSDLSLFGPMTIGYAAPEQIANRKRLISQRTDFFAWAIVMFELVTGTNPLREGTTSRQEIIQNTLDVDKINISLSTKNKRFETIIKKNMKQVVHLRSADALSIISFLRGS